MFVVSFSGKAPTPEARSGLCWVLFPELGEFSLEPEEIALHLSPRAARSEPLPWAIPSDRVHRARAEPIAAVDAESLATERSPSFLPVDV